MRETSAPAGSELSFRAPRPDDAARVFRLLSDIGGLERNSCYAYLLLCSHFAGTAVLAERGEALVGFVLAYRPPSDPASVFVWQVGVAPSERGSGLGRRLLEALLALPACSDAGFLTATVSPDNAASLALFRGFARARGVRCDESPFFTAELFAEPHLDENLMRIGPMKGMA